MTKEIIIRGLNCLLLLIAHAHSHSFGFLDSKLSQTVAFKMTQSFPLKC